MKIIKCGIELDLFDYIFILTIIWFYLLLVIYIFRCLLMVFLS